MKHPFSSGVTNHYLSAHRQRQDTASQETGFSPAQRHFASSRPHGVDFLEGRALSHPINNIEPSRPPLSPPHTAPQHLSSCPCLITRYKMISKIIASAFKMAATLLLTVGKQISHLQSKRSPLIFTHTTTTQMGNFIQCLALPPSIFQRHQHKRSTIPLLRPVHPTQ